MHRVWQCRHWDEEGRCLHYCCAGCPALGWASPTRCLSLQARLPFLTSRSVAGPLSYVCRCTACPASSCSRTARRCRSPTGAPAGGTEVRFHKHWKLRSVRPWLDLESPPARLPDCVPHGRFCCSESAAADVLLCCQCPHQLLCALPLPLAIVQRGRDEQEGAAGLPGQVWHQGSRHRLSVSAAQPASAARARPFRPLSPPERRSTEPGARRHVLAHPAAFTA